ncbi:MAG TPA: Ig-like domain-containing protein [Edaphobacter sp.]
MPKRMMRLRKLVVTLLVMEGMAWAQVASAPVAGQTASSVASMVSLQVTSAMTVSYGEAVNGVAQVTSGDGSAVTGTVTFYDGETTLCTLALKDGASCPESASMGFGVGAHVLTTVYSGDATHTAASSNAVTVMVKQDATSTSLASATNPVAAGGNVVFAAVVQGEHGAAAGKVSFRDGDVVMGEVPLDGAGRASLAVLMMIPGTHAITAVYEGSENSAGSTSSVLSQVVTAPLPASTTTLAVGASQITAGQNASFVAQVTASDHVATGSVTFVDGGASVGTAVLDAKGTAIWLTSALGVGDHSIVAQYAGDASIAPSASQPVLLTVKDGGGGTDEGLRLGVDTVTVNAGETAVVPVISASGKSPAAKTLTVSCSGLPDEAACSYAGGAVRIQTAGPRDCGTTRPYSAARLSLGGPLLAGLLVVLVPRRRGRWKGLLMGMCVAMVLGSISACGTGSCTDLGSRPGSYNVDVSLGGVSGVQQVVLKVLP